MSDVNIERKQAGSQIDSSEINELVRSIRSAVDTQQLAIILSDFQKTLPVGNLEPILGNPDTDFQQIYILAKS